MAVKGKFHIVNEKRRELDIKMAAIRPKMAAINNI